MSKWLNPVKLSGDLITLEPLALSHIDGLKTTVADGELWDLWYTTAPEPAQVSDYISSALSDYDQGHALPFAVIRQSDGLVVGTTRYLNADVKNKRLEIGNTFYAKSVQRTGVNTECKHLLLQYAFEQLRCMAVEFRTHFHNMPSRAAITRLGAKQEGVLRNHKIDRFGLIRDTVVFSILDNEWPAVKKSLEFKMGRKY